MLREIERMLTACPPGATVTACATAIEPLGDGPREHARVMASLSAELATLRAARDALAGA